MTRWLTAKDQDGEFVTVDIDDIAGAIYTKALDEADERLELPTRNSSSLGLPLSWAKAIFNEMAKDTGTFFRFDAGQKSCLVRLESVSYSIASAPSEDGKRAVVIAAPGQIAQQVVTFSERQYQKFAKALRDEKGSALAGIDASQAKSFFFSDMDEILYDGHKVSSIEVGRNSIRAFFPGASLLSVDLDNQPALRQAYDRVVELGKSRGGKLSADEQHEIVREYEQKAVCDFVDDLAQNSPQLTALPSPQGALYYDLSRISSIKQNERGYYIQEKMRPGQQYPKDCRVFWEEGQEADAKQAFADVLKLLQSGTTSPAPAKGRKPS